MLKVILCNTDGSPSIFKIGIVASVALNALDYYLKYRDYRHTLAATKPARSLEKTVTAEEFEAGKRYEIDVNRYSIVTGLFSDACDLGLKLLRFSPMVYQWTATCCPEYAPLGSVPHAILHMTALNLFSTILHLPMSYYYHFVVEQKHGFNNMTVGVFMKDKLKSLGLNTVLFFPIQCGFIHLVVNTFGERFPVYFVGGALAISLAALYVVPNFIMPLFDTYTPMEKSSSLYMKIETMCKKFHFPLDKVFSVDGSKKSGHSNAYVLGFGRLKRIVIYDTLEKHLDEDEIVAALAHEIGHWHYSHTLKMMGVGVIQLFMIGFAARETIFNDRIALEYGYSQTNPTIGFAVLMDLYALVDAVMDMVIQVYSRRCEYQADGFAVSAGYGETLISGLKKLHQKNKASIEPDWLYSAMKHSHPTLDERIDAIQALQKKTE